MHVGERIQVHTLPLIRSFLYLKGQFNHLILQIISIVLAEVCTVWTEINSFDFPTHNTFHSWITSPEFISLSPRSDIQFTTTVLMRWSGSYLKASANATDTFHITRGNWENIWYSFVIRVNWPFKLRVDPELVLQTDAPPHIHSC